MRGSALTHSGPVQNTQPRVSFSLQLSVDRVSTNIYYSNNTWTEPRGLVTVMCRFSATSKISGKGLE
jgi:hypothetical protein